MERKIGWLVAIALAQVVLLGILWFANTPDSSTSDVLLSFAPDDVSRLQVTDGDGAEVDVMQVGGQWRLADVAADTDKITRVLEQLSNLSAPWPVATTDASAERFEVADDNYQRRIRLYNGEVQLAEIYLGTSPGYQRVHARQGGDGDVYSVALSNFEFPAGADGWLDKSLLANEQAPQNIRVELADPAAAEPMALNKTEEGWLYNGAAANQDVAQTYANRFTTLRVLGLVGDDAEAWPVVATLHLGEDTTLTLRRLGEDGDFRIESSTMAKQFRVSAYLAEQLMMSDVDFTPPTDNPDEAPLTDEIAVPTLDESVGETGG